MNSPDAHFHASRGDQSIKTILRDQSIKLILSYQSIKLILSYQSIKLILRVAISSICSSSLFLKEKLLLLTLCVEIFLYHFWTTTQVAHCGPPQPQLWIPVFSSEKPIVFCASGSWPTVGQPTRSYEISVFHRKNLFLFAIRNTFVPGRWPTVGHPIRSPQFM